MTINPYLEHHGVKGMKWGRRKRRETSSGEKKRLSRKEVRRLNKQKSKEFYQKKADRLIKESASKGKDVLVSVKGFESFPTVMTGREFVTHLSNGGMFDIKQTDIYARRDGDVMVINDRMNERYKKIKR